jgi:hypothetical protein
MRDDMHPLERLEAFEGTWVLKAPFPDAPEGRVTFEWMMDGRFLIQRWDVDPPIPSGLAIIGLDETQNSFRQYYFDSRGVARIYQMSLSHGEWKLWRDTADFSPLEFRQRYTGRFSEDGRRIEGAWEISHDGVTWEHDFDLTYERL